LYSETRKWYTIFKKRLDTISQLTLSSMDFFKIIFTISVPTSKVTLFVLHYRDKLVNDVWGNNRYLFCDSYEKHQYTLWAKCRGI
jgi:hypothetical protein